jgi:hypothetical protein
MNIYDSIMYFGFYYSDSIFRLCYDKLIRPELYNWIISSKKKELLSEDSNNYFNIKWIGEKELDNLCIDEGTEKDILALKYLKNSIRFFKIYALLTMANLMTMMSFLMKHKTFKNNPIKKKYFSYFIIIAIFVETPYLLMTVNHSEQKKLEEIYKDELEKVKMFYKI